MKNIKMKSFITLRTENTSLQINEPERNIIVAITKASSIVAEEKKSSYYCTETANISLRTIRT